MHSWDSEKDGIQAITTRVCRLPFSCPAPFSLLSSPTLTPTPSYAEVLENTQFALIATVHKLYAMVRSGQPWELGEPELNDRGQPVIHNIASKLGCIRPNSDLDLPVHSVFPEDEAGLAELARQLEEQQKDTNHTNSNTSPSTTACNRTSRASSSDLDHSDFEDYRKAAFGGGAATALSMSPQSLSYGSDFDLAGTPSDSFSSRGGQQPPAMMSAFPSWISRPPTSSYPPSFVSGGPPPPPFLDMDMLNQGLLESSFGTIKPHVLSCPNPEVMMGMGDPMIYAGYDAEAMGL